jgi:CheY-like chemotaxis protein
MTHDKIILLVEDNPDDEALTLRTLKKNEIHNEIVVARDGVLALDYLLGTGAHESRDTTIQPHLVLLDLNLPRIDGLEVLRRMRADGRTKLVPVVVLTSSAQEEDVLGGYSCGANSYVRKPVDFLEFAETLKYLALFWLHLNEPPPRGRRLP